MIMSAWYEQYIGKPWKAAPSPPLTFNCGELIRYIYKHTLEIKLAEIDADATKLKECIANMRPSIFGLRSLSPNEKPQEFDCAFFARANYEDHCGIVVQTLDGLMILHCMQGLGVVLESPLEAKARGFRAISWYRHKGAVING